jgi:uncharacterized OsmC-like protein
MNKSTSKTLNSLEVSKLEKFVQGIKKPDVAKNVNGPWRSRVTWQGGLKAKAFMRNHAVTFDEPEGLGATDTSASAHEHLLSAVGACMLTGFVYQSTLKGVRIHNAEIAMEGTFGDIKNWAGLTDEGTPGYPEIKAKLFVKADADKKVLEKLWENAWNHSVVTQTVARGTKITPSVEIM